jgi:hypothetical protein
MTKELLTVVTATLGDSASHLNVMMEELRKFTSLPFSQIVSDDGTIDSVSIERQQEVVWNWKDATRTVNPGPVYGISYNLNHAMEQVKTPWAFIIEDGVRPGWGWLETAVDALKQIGMRQWQGREIGTIGLGRSFDHWELAAAGVLPGDLHPLDYYGKYSHETHRAFWSKKWNDGLLCWPRLLPAIRDRCLLSDISAWPEILRTTWCDQILRGDFEGHGWPKDRGAILACTGNAWGLIRMDAWRNAGRFRAGCTFYECHLGARLAKAGYVNVQAHNPPWLHYPAMGHAANAQGLIPRHHEPDRGPEGVFQRDFGVDLEGIASYVQSQYPPGLVERIQAEMAKVKLHADPRWEAWA